MVRGIGEAIRIVGAKSALAAVMINRRMIRPSMPGRWKRNRVPGWRREAA